MADARTSKGSPNTSSHKRGALVALLLLVAVFSGISGWVLRSQRHIAGEPTISSRENNLGREVDLCESQSSVPVSTQDNRVVESYSLNERYFLLRPSQYYHVSQVIVPGYYTLVVLSASWCAPCRPLRRELNDLVARKKSIVVVEIDASEARSVAHYSVQPFEVTEKKLELPSAFLFDPFGIYINAQRRSNAVAAPISGHASITCRLRSFFDNDNEQRSYDLQHEAKMSELRTRMRVEGHYAMHEGAGNGNVQRAKR